MILRCPRHLTGMAEARIAALQDRIAHLDTLLDDASDSGGDLAEARRELVEARNDIEALKSLSSPFLNWSGKAERLSLDVMTLPLFVHE